MSDETGLELSRRLQALTLVVPVRKIRPQSARRRQHRASLDEGIVTLKTAIDLQHRRANSYRMNGLERKTYRSRQAGFISARHQMHSVDSPRQNSLTHFPPAYNNLPPVDSQSARSYQGGCPHLQSRHLQGNYYQLPQHHQQQQPVQGYVHQQQQQQQQHQQHHFHQEQLQQYYQQPQQHHYQPQPPIVAHTPIAHPRSEMIRRSSGMALMGRVWKSDESVERPHMKKTVAVDVPSSSTGLLRQLFVNDNIVAPADSQSRKFTLLTITPKQRRALKASYLSLKSTGSWLKLFEQIFRRLETKCPEIRSIFLTTAFVNSLSRERDTPPLVKTEHDHCKCLVVILDELIHSDNMDESCAQLRSYGEKHAQMRESGFTPQMIEQFGEIAVSVIVANDGIKYNHEAVKAWRLFLACVTDEMRVGYEKHSKMSVRRNSKAQ